MHDMGTPSTPPSMSPFFLSLCPRLPQDRLRRKLEGDLENTRKLLQTEKAKASDAQKRAGGADKTRRTEQRDQIKVLQELQDLRWGWRYIERL